MSDDDDDDDDDADEPDVVHDFVARLRSPTLVMLEWTPPKRPGIIKYRVRHMYQYATKQSINDICCI